jgi:hypothetical protein
VRALWESTGLERRAAVAPRAWQTEMPLGIDEGPRIAECRRWLRRRHRRVVGAQLELVA